MKNLKKVLVALLAIFLLVGCSSNKGSGNSDIVSEITEDTEVVFWHAMNGAQEEMLTKLAQEFMAANEKITITLQNQSSYPDLQSKLNATFAEPSKLPTITQAYPGWLFNATEDKLLEPLKPYIEHTTIGMKDYEDIVEGFRNGASINDVVYGIPFNKSTEVLYYNKTILEENGVSAPTTFEELAKVSKEIFEKTGIIGAGFDSLNNYYATGLMNKGVEFTKDMDVTGTESKEVVDFYRQGVKEGYFRIAGSDGYLSGPFGSQLLAMNIGSSAGESHVAKAAVGNFEYGVVVRPEPINIQQGTDIYMFSSASANQKTAAFEFMKHLVSKESQIEWGIATGYIPVRTSAINDDKYKNSASLVAPLIAEATKNLYTLPVTANTDAVYRKSTELMELALSETSSDLEKLLANFKEETDALWNEQ